MNQLLAPDLAKRFVWAGRLTKKHAFRPLEAMNLLCGWYIYFLSCFFQVKWMTKATSVQFGTYIIAWHFYISVKWESINLFYFVCCMAHQQLRSLGGHDSMWVQFWRHTQDVQASLVFKCVQCVQTISFLLQQSYLLGGESIKDVITTKYQYICIKYCRILLRQLLKSVKMG